MLRWYHVHQRHFRDERKKLSSTEFYKEKIQCCDNFLFFTCSIIVRLSTIECFPILIAYPDSTPFMLPLIFPLVEELTMEELEQIGRDGIEKHEATILRKVRFFPQVRHQNPNGSLCILEWDNVEGGV